MRIEPRRHQTLTMLRLNQCGSRRLRGASPRRRARLPGPLRPADCRDAPPRLDRRPPQGKPAGEGLPLLIDRTTASPPLPRRPLRTRPDWPIYGPSRPHYTGRIIDVIA